MWKIFVGFVIFAAIAMFVVFQGGDKLDMQGEAGGHSTTESSTHGTSTPAPASGAAPGAASGAASGTAK